MPMFKKVSIQFLHVENDQMFWFRRRFRHRTEAYSTHFANDGRFEPGTKLSPLHTHKSQSSKDS